METFSAREVGVRPRTVERGLALFLHALLQLLADVTPEAEPPAMATFRTTIEHARTKLGTATAPEDVSAAAVTCVDACDNYLQRSRHYHAAREADFLDLIGFLRSTASTLIDGSSEFNAQVITSSDRMGTLSEVNELRELKRLISVEMSTLKRKAEMRQIADQELAADLTRRIASLETSLERASQEASIDPLTQVANRGSIDRAIPRLVEDARRTNRPLSVAMVDLDDFKKVNDTFGHLVGDRVLLFTAQTLLKGVRETDFVGRFGGEEFILALPGANLAQSVTRLDALVRQIADDAYQYTADQEARALRFTVSCGVAELIHEDTPTSLIARADDALLEAKRKGRNRVQISKPKGGLFSRVFARSRVIG